MMVKFVFSMASHGIHSAVFGFTYGAFWCTTVPLIKVCTTNAVWSGLVWSGVQNHTGFHVLGDF